MVGCAAMIALPAFAIGFLATLISGGGILPSLGAGAMSGGLAFLAALILAKRDQAQQRAVMRRVRELLLHRQDVSDETFLAAFPGADAKLPSRIYEFRTSGLENIHDLALEVERCISGSRDS
jgi:hypothetical protein